MGGLRRESGYTFLELVIVLAILGLVVLFFGGYSYFELRETRLRETIKHDLHLIAQTADSWRARVTSNTQNADFSYTETHNNQNTYTNDIAALNAAMGTDHPETNPFGLDYEWAGGNAVGRARTRVFGEFAVPWAVTSFNAGSGFTTFEVGARSLRTNRLARRAQLQKAQLHQETIR